MSPKMALESKHRCQPCCWTHCSKYLSACARCWIKGLARVPNMYTPQEFYIKKVAALVQGQLRRLLGCVVKWAENTCLTHVAPPAPFALFAPLRRLCAV